MSFSGILEKIMPVLADEIPQANFFFSYSDTMKNLSVKKINITLKEVTLQAKTLTQKTILEVNIFLPFCEKLKKAEEIFLQICHALTEQDIPLKGISKERILHDEDLAVMLVPCRLTIEAVSIQNKKQIEINGVAAEIESAEVSVINAYKKFTSFGESEPFDIYQEESVFRVVLKNFKGEDFVSLVNFQVVFPEDETIYLDCNWEKYSLSRSEFVFISSDRRELN